MIFVDLFTAGKFIQMGFISRERMNQHLEYLASFDHEQCEQFVCEITTVEMKPARLEYYSRTDGRIVKDVMLGFYKGHVFVQEGDRPWCGSCRKDDKTFDHYPTSYNYIWY